MRDRFCRICATTFAPAVFASDASSPSGSRGSAVEFAKITPTKIARSCLTDNFVRLSSANTSSKGSISFIGPIEYDSAKVWSLVFSSLFVILNHGETYGQIAQAE